MGWVGVEAQVFRHRLCLEFLREVIYRPHMLSLFEGAKDRVKESTVLSVLSGGIRG